ncbi:MAG: 50S ribosomal protein L34 [Candidatus Moranbacteria bacterium CG_4_9_14_3_um_filter_40_7]|nr:MAG: 50S ribosomal protein L34 [Candidatus Moranbacteria bacterium CG23_combo_of_CG06-09_8_20_14_all_40_16]PIU80986.1 MAG: 50S ribosomal protein L34 [Candidatus Moranbacteria bacterium CG06_land_8_20_14_3_00_40_12]PJA87827.1 MAG: 50S ribosomal protein L34 [Candidatus Moranbacteria bacterium CG_4_9_14_3_um_filter_40_7]
MSQTYKPKKLKRKRKHGFKKRSQTKDGREVMKRRRRKGRKKITTV